MAPPLPADGLEPSSYTRTSASRLEPGVSSSWRERIRGHQDAKIFPPLSPRELEQLGENLKPNGLKTPMARLGDEHLMNVQNGSDPRDRAGFRSSARMAN